MKPVRSVIILVLVFALGFFSYDKVMKVFYQNKMLKEVIARLEADTRIAEVLVTGVKYNEQTSENETTIKFLEYDVQGEPLEPEYFTFTGNLIQFQSLVIRFDDNLIRKGDKLSGKSAYLFWKVFVLDGENTKEYEITSMEEIPGGYSVSGSEYEKQLWQQFWEYALDADHRDKMGIKNAQIEAPGTMFVPGILYTIRIEHDGGMRIDSKSLSPILQGEKIPSSS
ncbi:MAG: hypothetical protein P9L88_02030 [Candidatus Tantalella remota]|nr:hypothetical protein [Candidatus Tantalella remota]